MIVPEDEINDPGSALNAFLLTQDSVTRLVGLGDEARIFSQFIPQSIPENVYALTFEIPSEVPLQHLTGVSGQSYCRLRLKHYAVSRQRAMFLANTIRGILLQGSGTRYWGPLFVCGVTLEFGPIDNADLPRDGSDLHRPNIVCDYSVSWFQRTERM